jgi:hypothetical protein
VLVLQPPVLESFQCLGSSYFLIKGEETKKQTKNPKFKCSKVSVLQHPVLVLSFSHQRKKEGKKKKGVGRQLCECLSAAAAAHLPPTVSHLLLQALFIESSPGHMPLLFFPIYSPTCLLQLQFFFFFF